MYVKSSLACCLVALLLPLHSTLAQTPEKQLSLSDRADVTKLAPQLAIQLRSVETAEQQKAVDTIRTIAGLSPRALSDNLSTQWLTPLLDDQRYAEVLELSSVAISDRGFDISIVEKLMEGRVQAYIGLGQLDEALAEAKGFYNICVLKNTPHAIDLLCSILERQGKAVMASRLRFEQTHAPATQPVGGTPTDDGFVSALPEASVLSSIKVQLSLSQEELNILARGHTFNDLMKQGNFALLLDKPEEARKSFEAACRATDGSSAKNIREAVEGIARSIRDMPNGSPDKANAFITDLRSSPEVAGKGLANTGMMDRLRTAAQQTVLAQVQATSIPPLELERASNKSLAGTDDVKIRFDFECATPMQVKKLSPTHFELSFTSPGFRNWFMIRVEGAAGRVLRIDVRDPFLSMDKWLSFNPVYSYEHTLSDPAAVVSEAINHTSAQKAWNGASLPDTSGQKWHYIPDVWQVNANAMGFALKLEHDAFVAMRVPMTAEYNENCLRSFSSDPSCHLVEIGKTTKHRPLLMLQIDGQENGTSNDKPTVLVYAGEHADEYDAMWVAHGAIGYLLSGDPVAKEILKKVNFLIIPMLDPDAAALGRHSGMYQGFVSDHMTPESSAYAKWFQKWVDSGRRLDLVLDLHNVQSRESGHVACAEMEGLTERGEFSSTLQLLLFNKFQSQHFSISRDAWEKGWSPDRLGGWLARRYGPICLHYEVNSQAEDRHLTQEELKQIGATFDQGAFDFLLANIGKKLQSNVDLKRQERVQRWSQSKLKADETDAISGEAKVSEGVGIYPVGNVAVEKWIQ